MTTHKLTSVYADPPVKTVGLVITWRAFWATFARAQRKDAEAFITLDIAGWLLEYNAFSDDGARMIER